MGISKRFLDWIYRSFHASIFLDEFMRSLEVNIQEMMMDLFWIGFVEIWKNLNISTNIPYTAITITANLWRPWKKYLFWMKKKKIKTGTKNQNRFCIVFVYDHTILVEDFQKIWKFWILKNYLFWIGYRYKNFNKIKCKNYNLFWMVFTEFSKSLNQ